MSEIWALSAREIGRAVTRGELSASEVLDAHLARIAQVNPSLNAVTVQFVEARETAKAVDRAVRSGDDPGPLAGVPFRSP
ncbi:amidase family protein [Nocardia sp. NPDC050799]|uniref:amidase family protein n=1 Tax=Nocardia sp. NPDC050799 TaxID=3154842 RepID=UPI00340812F0